MSAAVEQQPAEQTKQPKLIVTCAKCNQRFSVDFPKRVTVNEVEFSQILAVHQTLITCIICGQKHVPVIAGAQVSWSVLPIETEDPKDQSRIVLP